jgi:hypothetical protein
VIFAVYGFQRSMFMFLSTPTTGALIIYVNRPETCYDFCLDHHERRAAVPKLI